jgi:dUTP pyrophosphatase
MEQETIKIKYHSDKIEHLQYIDGKSDWIDLRAAEDVVLKKGDARLIDLGISVQLPSGYEMIIAPRSSTFKNFGIIQTNHIGVVDESYCGDNDILRMPVLAVRDTEIHINDRICQFRIIKHQPAISFQEVDHLDTPDRGGFGSTGIQ